MPAVGGGAGIGELARTPKWYARSQFDSLDGYEQKVSGGNITHDELGMGIKSGGSDGDYAFLYKRPDPTVVPVSWETDRSFASGFWYDTLFNHTGAHFHIGTGKVVPSTGDFTPEHVTFKLESGSIYGSVGNGSSETTSSELATYSVGERTRLRYEFKAGSQVDFYVDGTKQGSITTGLPSGAADANRIMVSAVPTVNETAQNGKIRVPEYRVVVYE